MSGCPGSGAGWNNLEGLKLLAQTMSGNWRYSPDNGIPEFDGTLIYDLSEDRAPLGSATYLILVRRGGSGQLSGAEIERQAK